MKKMIRAAAAALLLAVGATSCDGFFNETDGQEFCPIELRVEGTDVQETSDRFRLAGSMPAEGGTILVAGAGKYANLGYITGICVDGVMQERKGDINAGELLDTYPVLSGPWGSVEYLSTEAPYIMEITFTANDSPEPRIYEFQFGYGYWYRILEITQPA